MRTECNRSTFVFHPLGSRQVTAAFNGGTITSDGGALLLGEVEAQTGLLAALASLRPDRPLAHQAAFVPELPEK
ncbi:MAG: transposase [Pirellulales bacterium]